jgi:hypothetical protein
MKNWDDDSKPVRQERSGWRDEAISRRHREWGFNVPIADIDFLVCEYDRCVVAALVEYKNQHSRKEFDNAEIRTLRNLADRAQTPFFIVRYTDDLARYFAIPMNYLAQAKLPTGTLMSEVEYVSFLYKLRGRQIPDDVISRITKKDEDAA